MPVLLDGLLDDGSWLATHRDHRLGWYADLIGPLVVPATNAPDLVAELVGADHGLRVLLTATGDPGDALAALRAARGMLLDEGTVEVVGVRLPLPVTPDPAVATRRFLEELDFAVPAWLEVAAADGWAQALEVLADDGAEHACLRLDGTGGVPDRLAAILRRAVDLDLSLRISGRELPAVRRPDPAGDGSPGFLNAVCAVRAALNEAQADELAAILGETRAAPLVSAVRRMSEADAAVCRAFLIGAESTDVAAAVDELVALGLVEG